MENLSETTKQEADKVLELIKDGTIVVPTDEASTSDMLQELGFDATYINLSGE